jgi:hypothetical protein
VSAFCRNQFPHNLEIKRFPDHEFDFRDSDTFQRITAFGITLPSMLGTCLEVYCKWEVLPKGLLSVSSCFLREQLASGGIMYNSV